MVGIMAQTPMRCFRIMGLEIYTEDMTGRRELVCTATNEDFLHWLMGSLTSFHTNVPTLLGITSRAITPFTNKQIEALIKYQMSGAHEYTCENGHGILVPERYGWRCDKCTYKQDWAFAMHTGVV